MVMVDRGKAMREIEFIEAFPTNRDCGVDRNEPTAYMPRQLAHYMQRLVNLGGSQLSWCSDHG